MKTKDVGSLMEKLNYKFNDIKLLYEALTHRSYLNEHDFPGLKDNERLEFLGDAILDTIISDYLYRLKPDVKEGILSKMKGQIISEVIFSSVSREIGLGEYIYLSKGEESTGGRNRDSILGDVFESVIGAIYLDSDFLTTKDIAIKLLEKKINNIDNIEQVLDYKTELQELTQALFKVTPEYNTISEIGPDHNKLFEVEVCINGKRYAVAKAKSKKNAEKQAAKNTLQIFKDKKL